MGFLSWVLTGDSDGFKQGVDDELEWDRREAQSQIEYTNAWLNTGGYDEYDVFDECPSIPKKEVWWKIW